MMELYNELVETTHRAEGELTFILAENGPAFRLNLFLIKIIQLADHLDKRIALEANTFETAHL